MKQQVPLIFEQLDQAIDLTRQAGRGQLGELEIGLISSAMVDVIADALHAFGNHYPNVKWRLHEMAPIDQITALEEKRIDLCIFRVGYTAPDAHKRGNSDVKQELLMHEPICAVLPESHALADEDTIALSDLAEEPFVTFELGRSRLADFLHQNCIQAGFQPHISQQVIEAQTLLRLVSANFGVAMLPASMKQFTPEGIVFRRLVPSLQEVPLYQFYRASDTSPILKLLVTTLREQCSKA